MDSFFFLIWDNKQRATCMFCGRERGAETRYFVADTNVPENKPALNTHHESVHNQWVTQQFLFDSKNSLGHDDP